MIDIHAHILPNVDDGPSNIEESIHLARQAVKAGFQGVIATPHHNNGVYSNPASSVISAVDSFNATLLDEGIPLTVYPGQEVRMTSDVVNRLDLDLLTLGITQKNILIELDYQFIPSFIRRAFFEIQMQGYTPIIAHPERNSKIIANPKILFDFINEGALAQLTSGSLLGEFGKDIQSLSEKCIEQGLIHFIATDSHSGPERMNDYEKALKKVSNDFGPEVKRMFVENSTAVICGGRILKPEPLPFSKKGVFQRLFF